MAFVTGFHDDLKSPSLEELWKSVRQSWRSLRNLAQQKTSPFLEKLRENDIVRSIQVALHDMALSASSLKDQTEKRINEFKKPDVIGAFRKAASIATQDILEIRGCLKRTTNAFAAATIFFASAASPAPAFASVSSARPTVLAGASTTNTDSEFEDITHRVRDIPLEAYGGDGAVEGASLTSYPNVAFTLPHSDDAETRIFNAMILQESGGRQYVNRNSAACDPLTSSAGAIGIAQVILETAKITANRIGIAFDDNSYKCSAEYNYRLGRAYFAHLVSYFDGDYIKAIAGYNAGEGTVDKAVKFANDAGEPDKWRIHMLKPGKIQSESNFWQTWHYVNNVVARVNKGGNLEIDLSSPVGLILVSAEGAAPSTEGTIEPSTAEPPAEIAATEPPPEPAAEGPTEVSTPSAGTLAPIAPYSAPTPTPTPETPPVLTGAPEGVTAPADLTPPSAPTPETPTANAFTIASNNGDGTCIFRVNGDYVVQTCTYTATLTPA